MNLHVKETSSRLVSEVNYPPEILLWKLELEESMWLKVYPHVIPGEEEDNHLS